MHGPTEKELGVMKDWIADLAAFVKGEDHVYGTKAIHEFKVVTPEGVIAIQRDERWMELLQLAEVFAGEQKEESDQKSRI